MANNTITLQVKLDGPAAGLKEIRDDLKSTKQEARDAGVELTKALGSNVTEKAADGFRATAVAANTARNAVASLTSTAVDFRTRIDALDASLTRTTQIHEKLIAQANPLSQGFAQVSAQIQRESDMLDRINGPMRQFQENVRTLQSLQDKGLITAKQYTDELYSARKAVDEGGSVTMAKPGGAGGGGDGGGASRAISMLGGGQASGAASLVSGGAVVGAGVAAAAVGLIKAGDAYDELTNRVQKFTIAGQTTDQVIQEQIGLSAQLHSNLETSMGLYDQVRDGLEDTNASEGENIRLTKEIGETVKLSGKSLADAGGLMTTLSYAFANGTITGRELKAQMKEFPAFADLMTNSLHMTRSELMKLANDGKLTGDMIRQAFDDAGPALGDRFVKQIETTQSKWERFKDTLGVGAGKLGDLFNAVGGSAQSDNLSASIQEQINGMQNVQSLYDRENEAAQKVVAAQKVIADQVTQLKQLRANASDADKGKIDEQIAKQLAGADALTQIAKEEAAHKAKTLSTTSFTTEQLAKSTQEISEQERLTSEIADHLSAGAKELSDMLGKVEKATADFGAKFSSDLDAAKVKAAAITAAFKEAYKYQQAGFSQDHFKDSNGNALSASPSALLEQANAAELAVKKMQTSTASGKTLDISARVEADKAAIAELSAQINANVGDVHAAHAVLKQYREDLRNAYGDGGVDFVKQQLEAIVGPQKAFQGGIAATNYLLAAHAITAREAADNIKRLTDAYASKDFREALDFATGKTKPKQMVSTAGSANFADTLQNGSGDQTREQFDALAKNADDVLAKLVALEAESAKPGEKDLTADIAEYDQLNAAILRRQKLEGAMLESFREPQKAYEDGLYAADRLYATGAISVTQYDMKVAELKKTYKDYTDQVDKFAHRDSAEAQTIDGIKTAGAEIRKQMDITAQSQKIVVDGFNDISTAITDLVTKGTTDWRGMIRNMLAEMTKLLLYRAAFSFIGGGGGGVGGGGASGLEGIATASEGGAGLEALRGLLGFATGGMIAPGGSGGIDSQVVAFRKSPDETVRVTTPQQEARLRYAANGGGGGRMPPITINNYSDPNAPLRALDTRRGVNTINNSLASRSRSLVGTITRRQR